MKKRIEKVLVYFEVLMLGVSILLFSNGKLNKIWNATWKMMLFLGFIYFLYLFLKIHCHERRLLLLYSQRDKKIAEIKTMAESQNFIDGMARREELNFQEEISPLERQRKYDLEKIPFLKN